MSLALYDNTTGFRPVGKVLDYWKFIPQTQPRKDVHSLFGNPKSMLVPNLIVVLLILFETGLFYTMQEEGVSSMTLIALSATDFIIGILPAIIFINANLIISVIKTNIFITKTKLNLPSEIPDNYQSGTSKYHDDLTTELNAYSRQKNIYHIIEILLALVIIAFGYWKFYSLYDIFGHDILVLGIGRYIIVVILLSLITHIFFTKIVFANLIFRAMLGKQLKDFRQNNTRYSVKTQDNHKSKAVIFFGKYNYACDGNQFIARKMGDTELISDSDKGRIITIEVGNSLGNEDNETMTFSKRRAESNENVYIVTTGILTDPEISELVKGQPDSGSEIAILATAKQIQLSFT